MKKKSIYFIYIIPQYYKNHLITIEYPKKIENKNIILWGIDYNDLDSKRFLIKNLNLINFETKKNEEIKFKFKLTTQGHIFESKTFLIPEKSRALFVYNLLFESSGFFSKDIPDRITIPFEEQYFIFTNDIMNDVFSSNNDIEYDFINDTLNEMKKNKELNFLIYLDLIKRCYEVPIFNEFLNLFPQRTKLIYQPLKIKEYKDLIDKISSNEFENKLKKNEETKKNIQYLHQIILIFYYKIGEYDKFKEYFINKALFSELLSIQNFF